MMRSIGNHVQASLVRGITAQAELSAVDREETILIVESLHTTDWASATFVGAQHRLQLRLQGCPPAVEAAAAALDHLATREFDIAGQIVADITATRINTQNMDDGLVSISLMVNALTIYD